jgi:FixJ family two-component response regulator
MISVVDGDESVRISIGALVRSLGRVARTAALAEDFLNSAEAQDTDCLIAEIQMPGMTGVELQQALATAGRRIPIIFITGSPKSHPTAGAGRRGRLPAQQTMRRRHVGEPNRIHVGRARLEA